MFQTTYSDRLFSKLNSTLAKTDEGWDLQLDVPGYREEEITVELSENRSTLTARGDSEDRGPFKVVLPLSGVVSSDVKASLKYGVLTIHLKKATPVTHRIQIN